MSYIPKPDLIDGAFYNVESPMHRCTVAQWSGKNQCFQGYSNIAGVKILSYMQYPECRPISKIDIKTRSAI